jgi:hypothetical protein
MMKNLIRNGTCMTMSKLYGHILMICPACETMHEVQVRKTESDIHGYCVDSDKKFHIDDYYFD